MSFVGPLWSFAGPSRFAPRPQPFAAQLRDLVRWLMPSLRPRQTMTRRIREERAVAALTAELQEGDPDEVEIEAATLQEDSVEAAALPGRKTKRKPKVYRPGPPHQPPSHSEPEPRLPAPPVLVPPTLPAEAWPIGHA
jgi:hypothetical protein